MFVKMVLRLVCFVKMESLAMKANHPLATYGGIFAIVMNVEKKQLLKKIIQEEERKNPLNKSSNQHKACLENQKSCWIQPRWN